VFAWVLAGFALLVLIIKLIERFWKVIEPVLDLLVKCTCYALATITSPVWGPLYLLGIGVRAAWRMDWCVRARVAILNFGVAVRQVWRDTVRFLRAFLSAKWRRMCPYIEWE